MNKQKKQQINEHTNKEIVNGVNKNKRINAWKNGRKYQLTYKWYTYKHMEK